ncbi:MAG: hypothetical protein AB8B69_09575 [Chitinophagales bacterium]
MYYRITAQCVLYLLLFIAWGCENKKTTQPTNIPDGKNIGEPISPHYLKDNFPVLDSISQTQEGLHQTLNSYAHKLQNASKLVKSDEDLETLFSMRDTSIIDALHKEVLDPIAIGDGVFYHSPAGAKLDKELKTLGMQAIYAEGMYLNLGPSEMLKDEMQKYASEVFMWYMDFQSAKTTSMMGEYPFLNLDGQGKMVAVGEQMRTKYPDHAFTQKIEADMRSALTPLTDVHVIKSEFDKSYMVNGLATEFYPNATNIDALRKFASDFPDSQYSKISNKIVENMSEMEPAKGGWKDLHLVVVSWEAVGEETFTDHDGNKTTVNTCTQAQKARDEFLDKGIDIPHLIQLPRKKGEACALVYRFYADKNKANAALKEIKSKVSSVEGIVQLTFDPLERTWSVK